MIKVGVLDFEIYKLMSDEYENDGRGKWIEKKKKIPKLQIQFHLSHKKKYLMDPCIIPRATWISPTLNF